MSIKYVGPFFYIDNKIKALKVDVNKGEKIFLFIIKNSVGHEKSKAFRASAVF